MKPAPERPASPARPATSPAPSAQELDVLQAIRETRFGTVEVTVHQSRIVQITRSEKVRYETG